MVNDPTITSNAGRVYFPRAQVLWGPGGIQNPTAPATDEIPWLLNVEVRKTRWYTADRFKCEFALFGDPGFSYEWWGNIPNMNVAIQIGFDEATPQGRTQFRPFTQVFKGFVDKIEQDAYRGIVTITGRDFCAALNDTTLVDAYPNATMQDVLTKLAATHGYKVVFDGDYTATFGRLQNDEKTHQTAGMGSRQISQTDMVKLLVDQLPGGHVMPDHTTDDTIVFSIDPNVNQWTINAPQPDIATGRALHQPSNFTRLKFEHALAFTECHQVVAIREHGGQQQAEVHVYPEHTDGCPNGIILHQVPARGVSYEDADRIAQSHYHDYISKEWMLTWETSDPELIDMTPMDSLNVICPGDNGGVYLVDSVEFKLDTKQGFRATVSGKAGRDIGG